MREGEGGRTTEREKEITKEGGRFEKEQESVWRQTNEQSKEDVKRLGQREPPFSLTLSHFTRPAMQPGLDLLKQAPQKIGRAAQNLLFFRRKKESDVSEDASSKKGRGNGPHSAARSGSAHQLENTQARPLHYPEPRPVVKGRLSPQQTQRMEEEMNEYERYIETEWESRVMAKWRGMLSEGWEVYASGHRSKAKRRIRRGIPDCFRGYMWQRLSGATEYLRKPENRGLYQKLLHSGTSEWEGQIAKDTHRTLPSHIFFRDANAMGQQSLFNVLKAYSLYDPDLGYMQGMAFVSAVLLLYMDEEQVFWMLVTLLQSGMSFFPLHLFFPFSPPPFFCFPSPFSPSYCTLSASYWLHFLFISLFFVLLLSSASVPSHPQKSSTSEDSTPQTCRSSPSFSTNTNVSSASVSLALLNTSTPTM